jgi:L-alanine-DL-glutamate epimerase-like enolase superfamily enzyme
MIRELTLTTLQIPFKVAFRHAAASRDATSSLWVEATTASGSRGRGESCPRPYVTGESVETARAFFARYKPELEREVEDLATLRAWAASHESDLDTNPAAWCAVELALLDAFAREEGLTIEQFLSLPALAGRFRYTAVLGDQDGDAFRASAAKYRRFGFQDFKVKLSGDPRRDLDKVAVVREWGEATRVRADANNLWESGEAAVAFLRELAFPFFAIEEPIRSNQYADLARVAEALERPIILDESLLRTDQIGRLGGSSASWLINVRVSKMGGLLRSLEVVQAAGRAGIGVIVGAQVGETSLLTRVALTVAQAAGPNLVAQEGAFGTFLLERDICDPPLMFGAGGILDASSVKTGAGIDV